MACWPIEATLTIRAGADLGETGEIRLVGAHEVRAARCLGDLRDRGRDPARVPAVDEHGRAGPGEVGRQDPAHPVGRAGEQDDLPVESCHGPYCSTPGAGVSPAS